MKNNNENNRQKVRDFANDNAILMRMSFIACFSTFFMDYPIVETIIINTCVVTSMFVVGRLLYLNWKYKV